MNSYNKLNNQNSIILPINCGYYQFKSLNNQQFLTRISEVQSDIIQTSDDILYYENKYHIIGHGLKNVDLNKTENDFLVLCILNMCSRFMQNEVKDIKLVLTAPPLTYSEQSILLPQLLINGFNFICNGIKRTLIISDCIVFPETFPVFLANNPEQYRDKILYILDIGGYTTNLVKISNLSFNPIEDYISIPKGMYHIDTLLRDYLITNTHSPFELDDIPIIRNSGFKGLDVNMKDIINIFNSLLNEIIIESKIKGWNVKFSELLVTGGGGQCLYEYIKIKYPQAILSNNTIFDNLYGLNIIAKEVYGG